MKPARIFFTLAVMGMSTMLRADDDHSTLPYSVDAFHEIISKDWHAPEGPERLKSASVSAPAYAVAAERVADDEAPDGITHGQWKARGFALFAASAALGTSCKTGNDSEIAASLAAVHDRFHEIVDLIAHK